MLLDRDGLLLQDLDGDHAIHPELGQLLVLLRPAHDVIVVLAPDQGVGAEHITIPAVLQDLFLAGGVLYVPEGDLPLFLDGGMDHVHRVIDRLIALLDRAVHVYGPIQLPGLLLAGESCQLAEQIGTFLSGDEVGGLHCVHQQLQLRELEQPLAYKVAVLGAFVADDVHALLLQELDVAVYALAAGLDAVGLPELQDA